MFFVKLAVANTIIIAAALVGRKMPSLSGLIATMPLTTLIVLFWLYADDPGNYQLMKDYTKAVVLGIVPSLLFFVAAWSCFHNHLSMSVTMMLSGSVWLATAAVHQYILR